MDLRLTDTAVVICEFNPTRKLILIPRLHLDFPNQGWQAPNYLKYRSEFMLHYVAKMVI